MQIVSLNFDTKGERLITGSFDHTVKIWDVRTGRPIHTLSGHHGEISSTQVPAKQNKHKEHKYTSSPPPPFLLFA
jgi:WD40 repeat protein